MAVEWVGQEDSNGCGPATLAMLLDMTYREARDIVDANRAMIGAEPIAWGSADAGCWEGDLDLALAQHGCFLQRRYSTWLMGLDPFVSRHYAMVRQPSNRYHFVVMDDGGRVFDPLRAGVFALSEWEAVPQLVGVFRLGRPYVPRPS